LGKAQEAGRDKMSFSFEETAALAQGRLIHHHRLFAARMEAVLLKTQNLTHQMICQLCGMRGTIFKSSKSIVDMQLFLPGS
jgi:hypothetical protein